MNLKASLSAGLAARPTSPREAPKPVAAAAAASAKLSESSFSPARAAVAGLGGAAAPVSSGLLDTLKQTVTKGVDLLRQGAEEVRNLADGGASSLKKTTIDDPIDSMKPGDTVSINESANVYGQIPLGDKHGVGGKVDISNKVQVTADDDGGYTIRDEAGMRDSVNVGVGGDTEGGSANGDVGVAGSVTHEYKVKPVMVDDGNGHQVVDVAATKAKAKELTDLLANPRIDYGRASSTYVGKDAGKDLDLRTPEQKQLMADTLVATEYRGTVAQNVAAELKLPDAVKVGGSGSNAGELMVRIENKVPQRDANGQPVPGPDGKPQLVDGAKITVSTTVTREGTVDGEAHDGGPTRPFDTVNGDGKQSTQISLTTTLEYPGAHVDSPSDLLKLRDQTPHVHAQLKFTTDTQLGGGTGKGADVVVANGGTKDVTRVGSTTTATIDVDNPEQVAGKVWEQAREGHLADAAKLAGDQAKVQVKTTLYTEHERSVTGGYNLVGIFGEGGKAESVQRHPIATLGTPDDVSVSQVAQTVQQQIREAQERTRPLRNPVLVRG